MPNLSVREMRVTELQEALQWAIREGWSTAVSDYPAYYAQDKQGFLTLLLDERPIGSISIVRYSEKFAFIGLFIVLPEYRGLGYGAILWENALQRIEKMTSIGLYAVPQQIGRYANAGFFKSDMLHRWTKEFDSRQKEQASFPERILVSDDERFASLMEYDTQLWGGSREQFLRVSLLQANCYALVSMQQDKVNGYAVMRPSAQGYRIGPVYCDELRVAQILTQKLLSIVPPRVEVIFDIPTSNRFSMLFAEYFNLEKVAAAELCAMYKGEIPHGKSATSCYGLSSLEIG